MAAVEVRPAVGQVPPEGSDGMPADRDDPFLVALAHAADEPVLEVDAAPLEPDRLADAQARAVEELDERMIPPGPRSRPVGGRNQALDLSRRERPRQLPAAARRSTSAAGLSARTPRSTRWR